MAHHEADFSQQLSPSDQLAALVEKFKKRKISDEETIEVVSTYMAASQQALADIVAEGESGVDVATVTAGITNRLTILGATLILRSLHKSDLSTRAITSGIERSISFWQEQNPEDKKGFIIFRERQIANLNAARSLIPPQTAN